MTRNVLALAVLVLANADASDAQRARAATAAPTVVRVTGGAPVASTPGSAAQRPAIRRVRPIEVRELPEFSGQAQVNSFTLAPMRLVEPNRGWMQFEGASVYPDDADGWVKLFGMDRWSSFVEFHLQAEAGKTYVLDIAAHPEQSGPQRLDIITPAGVTYVQVSRENPRAILGYAAPQDGVYRFRLMVEGNGVWYFQGVSVTVLQ